MPHASRYTELVQRLPILVVALLIGAAAPVRAWCEAACLAPAHQPASHCPSHEASSSDAAAMAATSTADCPVIDAARPVQARLDFAAAPVAFAVRTPAPTHPSPPAPTHPRTAAPSHPGKIPLRV